jgi:hypothetical protein
VFVVPPDLKTPVVVIGRVEGVRIRSVILAAHIVGGEHIAVAGKVTGRMRALEISPPPLLAPQFSQPRPLPILPSPQRNVRTDSAIRSPVPLILSFALYLSVNKQSVKTKRV